LAIIGKETMDAKTLFLERCKQVEALMQSHKEIDLLDLAAKLRQLLLDGDALMRRKSKVDAIIVAAERLGFLKIHKAVSAINK
jgi:hypothetical protein